MSDASLRALERLWRATSAREDEAAWLVARAREGDVSQRALEFAAYCGWEIALALSDSPEPQSFASLRALSRKEVPGMPRAELLGPEGEALYAWVFGLRRWGKQACLRAALAAAAPVLRPPALIARACPLARNAVEQLRVAVEWALDPTTARRHAAATAAHAEAQGTCPCPGRVTPHRHGERMSRDLARLTSRRLTCIPGTAARIVVEAARVRGVEVVRRDLSDDLAGWALDERDALLDLRSSLPQPLVYGACS